jgi:[ribosomal protein S5]-alanine N-acetyltransferase
MNKVILETSRLILKTITPSYAQMTLDFYIMNKDFFEPYEPLREQNFYTKQHQRLLLKYDQEGLSDSSMIRFWLFEKNNFTQPIGTISLTHIVRGVFQSCFLGYKISAPYAQKGLMTEALFEVISYAFSELNLHRIEANIMPSNEASLALVRKFGFHEEGMSLRYLKINGFWEDHLRFALLNEE